MKKLFYYLPIIGLLLFASCQQEENDDIINNISENTVFNIQEAEDPEGKFLTINPGLYGPNQTTPFTNVNYTLVVPQDILNTTPVDDHKYFISIYYQRPGGGWTLALSTTYVSSNNTTLSFPDKFDGSKRYKWLLSYGFQAGGANFVKYKEVDINH